MRNSDAVRIRRQFKSYSKLAQDIKPRDCVYAAVLPPPGNTRKLQIKDGAKDMDPLFKLPRLPKSVMDQLSQESEEFELPGKSNQDVIDEFYSEWWPGCQHKFVMQGFIEDKHFWIQDER